MTTRTIAGYVEQMTTSTNAADETVEVVVKDSHDNRERFTHPDGMTDEQLEEFKRAQDTTERPKAEIGLSRLPHA